MIDGYLYIDSEVERIIFFFFFKSVRVKRFKSSWKVILVLFSAFVFVSFFFSLSFNILRFIIIIDKYCCSTIFLRYLLTITLMLMKFMMAFTVCKHTDENLW